MRHILRIRDFQNVVVILSWTTWKNHILKRHPDMQAYLDALKVTITTPSRGYDNTRYKHGLSLWKFGLGRRRRAKHWVCVVINYKQNPITRQWHGEVATACFAKETPDNEERVF